MRYARAIAVAAVTASAGLTAVMTAGLAARPPAIATWNARAAAAYLDERQGWWESWSRAKRDRGTVCVSCHTAVPYALVRPELRAALHESDTTAVERKLVADVVTRVRAWSEVAPFYGDTTRAGTEKAIQSRGTEAVLNAFILASRDQRVGVVSAEARQAFAHLFALQDSAGDQAGAWAWLNFELRPWESRSAVYYGAALAAIAAGMEPEHFAERAGIHGNMALLRSYLRTHVDQPLWSRLLRRDNPDLFNRAMLLWASAKLPALISRQERDTIVEALWRAQAADGSWQLGSLGHWHSCRECTSTAGDGYATGLIAYALEQNGSAPNEPHLARALTWLAQHQDTTTGMWRASSLNRKRDPTSNVGKFMSDAATAYAALALTGGGSAFLSR